MNHGLVIVMHFMLMHFFKWSGFTPYIFPPFKLLGRVLNKIMEDELEEGLIVCPFWPNQT